MRKTIISAAMATTILVGSATAAFAAPTHYIVGGKAYTINDLTNDGYMANYQEDAKGKTVYITDKDANKTITIADLAGREYSEAIKGGKNRADEITEDVKIVGADLKPGESLEVPGKDEVTALEIISISVINETGVTVEFAALEAAIEGATVEVKNPAGEVVETDAVDIAAEATEATFTFVTALEEIAVGTWTVNGVEYVVADEELAVAIEAAEAAITALEVEALNEDNVKQFKENIEAARALVTAVEELNADAKVENLADLVTAEALLESVTAELVDVDVTVNTNTRAIDVTGTVNKLKDDVITVKLVKTDAEDLSTDVVEEIILIAELDEDNKFTTALDLKDEVIAEDVTYTVEVIAAEAKEVRDVTLDFTAADETVAAVKAAKSQTALKKALVAGGFDFTEANLVKYATGNNFDSFKTINEIQEKLTEMDKDIANKALVGELIALAEAPVVEADLLAKLEANFENVNDANVLAYIALLQDSGQVTAATKPSVVQEKINIINAQADFDAIDGKLDTALGKIDGDPDTPKQADVDTAKALLEELKVADKALQLAKDADATYVPADKVTQAETKIETAEGKIEAAEGEEEALAEAITAAKVAQKNYLLAGGKRDDTVYVNVVTELEKETKVTDDIVNKTNLLKADTQTLKDIETTIPVAEKALADFVEAGGDVEAENTTYKKVEASLVVLKNAEKTTAEKKTELDKLVADKDQEGSIAKLDTATEVLVNVSEELAQSIEDAKTAMAAYVTAEGDVSKKVYTTVKEAVEADEPAKGTIDTAVETLEEATKGLKAMADYVAVDGDVGEAVYTNLKTAIEAESPAKGTITSAITAIEAATKEIKDVKAINDAIETEDVDALQEVILGVGSTTFADLSKAQRAELGEYIINQAKKEDPVTVYTSTDDFKNAIDTVGTGFVAKYQTDIEAFNDAANEADVNGTTKAALVDAIEELVNLEGLSQVDKLDLAEAIFAAKPEGGYAVKTIAQIRDIASTTPYSLR